MRNVQPWINKDTLRVWIPRICHGTILHLAIVVFVGNKKGIWILQGFTCDN